MDFTGFISVLTFSGPMIGSLLVFFFRKNLISSSVSLISIFIAFLCTLLCSFELGKSGQYVIVPLNGFYIDGLSILMQFMAEIVAFFGILYSIKELLKLYEHRKKNFYLFYCAILLSTGFMNLSFMLNNLFLVYISLELSSIVAVYLITFNLSKEALKAGFRYLLIVNIGILFSLVGIVLLFYATEGNVLIADMGQNVRELSKIMAFICAGLFIVGFFTKAGLIPFHTWLPDTYSQAPTAVTVFLSGGITKIGLYGVTRTLTVFSSHLEEIKLLVILLSSVSMLFAAILSFSQKDVKKLIAYTSISEMGIIAGAFAINSYLSIFGGLFHLLNHTLMKATLFFSIGALIYIKGTKIIDELKGIGRENTSTATSFFIGALAVGGLPLFGSFYSSVTIFLAFYQSNMPWTSVLLALSGFISALALLRAATKVFWSNAHPQISLHVPLTLKFCFLFFSFSLILVGIFPQTVYPLLHIAAMGILKIVN